MKSTIEIWLTFDIVDLFCIGRIESEFKRPAMFCSVGRKCFGIGAFADMRLETYC